MMPRDRVTRTLWTALLAASCTGGAGGESSGVGIAFSVAPTYPVPGDSVTLTLRNNETEPIGYNLCTARLVRGATGTTDLVPEDRICTMELRLLPPGGADSLKLQLPDSLTGPSYHYVLSVERQAAGETVEISAREIRPRR